jgi:serine/threonine protein kinase/tetratricopeptide (TPR) repeat protein
MIGDSIAHYKVLEKLGAGGMGEVYLVEDTRLGRRVALKLLPASFQYDAERRERFLREARAASLLRSPNVAAIYDIGEGDGALFIAMEYVEGELLSNQLEFGPLDLYQAIDIATQIGEALDEAHGLGIVHRDIKSSNLIVTPRGLVKELDFGLAKMSVAAKPTDEATTRLGLETRPGVILGTAAYMSPEQARGLEVDSRSDLFSLGVLLYEMLTGKRPFEGATTGDLLVAILSQEPEPLQLTAFPTEVQWVVSKALRKDKTQRYQTARDFIIDLKNLAQGLSTRVLAPPTGADRDRHTTRQMTPPDSGARDSGARRRARKQVDSIAVLPLVNQSEDADTEYLSDGITESLINALARLPKLRVMARSTVFRYKGRAHDPQRLGAELNVRAVLVGRMRKVQDRFLISAELVDTTDGALLWGEQYTEGPSDLFALQDRIAGDISEKLRLKLSSRDKRRLARRQTRNAAAYELYLKGRYHWGKFTAEGLRDAITCFEQALGKDPDFALAYAGLGAVYGVEAYLSSDPAQSQGAILKAKAMARRALELDDGLADAHLVLANIAHLHDWDWPLARQEFRLALELNPNDAEAHMSYGLFLGDQRLFEHAFAEIELAEQLDPLSVPVNSGMALLLFYAGRYEEAVGQVRKAWRLAATPQAAELHHTPRLSHQLLGAALEQTGNHDEAVAEYVRIIPEEGGGEAARLLRAAYAEAGIEGFWRCFTGLAQDLWARKLTSPLFVAVAHATLGDTDAAFAWLERGFSERIPTMSHIQADPRFEPLRGDPRFSQLLRRMGLTEAAGAH